jgi:fermentation-respiration switch protein FrsA (DUF1100 family)
MAGGADLLSVGAALRWRAAVAERQGAHVHLGDSLAWLEVALGGLAMSACCLLLRRLSASQLRQLR